MQIKPVVSWEQVTSCFVRILLLALIITSQPANSAESRNYSILLDVSGSMREALAGTPKYIIAQQALRQLKATLVGQDNVSLHFFATGIDERDDAKNCLASSRIVENGTPITSALIETVIGSLDNPKGRKTNIAFAMEIATQELTGLGGGKIILISDGQENCDLDPIPLARALQQANIPIDTIGIGGAADFSQLGRIALAGGGSFQLADSAQGLAEALSNSAPMTGPPDLPLASPPGDAGGSGAGGSGAGSNGVGAGGGAGGSGPMAQVPAMPAPPTQPLPFNMDMTVADEPKRPVAIEIILDVSGSMAGKLEGQQKIVLARRALAEALEGLDAESFVVGFRAYGFDMSLAKTPEASCPNTVLLNPVAPHQIASIKEQVNELTPYGYTPLAKSLELAGQDLLAVDSDKQIIILLTDGEESCGGDPRAVAAGLREKGIDLEVHIVGFDLEVEAATGMTDVAQAGGGDYYDARNASELTNALTKVVEVSRNKVHPKWLRTISPTAGGTTPEAATPLTSGTYTLTNHLEKGEARYFRVHTLKAQHGVVRGLIQSRRLVRQGDEHVETESAYAQYQISILELDGSAIGGRSVRLYGDPGTFGHIGYSDLRGEGFIFSISSNYDRVHKDALFNIEITDASDQFLGIEAPDRLGDTSPLVSLNTTITGHLGDGDRKDVYKVLLEAGINKVTLELKFLEPEFFSRLVVRGLTKNRQIHSRASRGEPYAVTFDVPEAEIQGLMIEIRATNPALRSKFSPYVLTIKTEAGP